MVRTASGHGNRPVAYQVARDIDHCKELANRGDQCLPCIDRQVAVDDNPGRCRVLRRGEPVGRRERGNGGVRLSRRHFVGPHGLTVERERSSVGRYNIRGLVGRCKRPRKGENVRPGTRWRRRCPASRKRRVSKQPEPSLGRIHCFTALTKVS